MSRETKGNKETIDIQAIVQEAKKEIHEKKEFRSQDDEHRESDMKDFVRDQFFEEGHVWLKARQIFMNLIFLTILVVPVLILFNSLTSGEIWEFLHYWTYQDGFALTDYLESSILLAVIIVLVLSLAFLLWNNYREQKVYPEKKTYDEKRLNKRKEILYGMYAERFGEKEFRESTKYYAVDGDKNIDDRLIEDLFKDNGVEIK
jgi:ABC-type multidrug transport system fused ATPase/permease subunit